RLGAVDFIEKPVSLAKLLRTVEKALAARRSRTDRRALVQETAVPAGKSQAIRSLRDQTARVAHHDAHTLFTGEHGSGRQLFARYLASHSERARAPFVVVMGGDLTEQDAERLLFGRGDQAGALERASGGILFISGLNDLS